MYCQYREAQQTSVFPHQLKTVSISRLMILIDICRNAAQNSPAASEGFTGPEILPPTRLLTCSHGILWRKETSLHLFYPCEDLIRIHLSAPWYQFLNELNIKRENLTPENEAILVLFLQSDASFTSNNLWLQNASNLIIIIKLLC